MIDRAESLEKLRSDAQTHVWTERGFKPDHQLELAAIDRAAEDYVDDQLMRLGEDRPMDAAVRTAMRNGFLDRLRIIARLQE